MHSSQPIHSSHILLAFAVAIPLMILSMAVNVLPTLRGGSAQARQKAYIRVAVINGIILVAMFAYLFSRL